MASPVRPTAGVRGGGGGQRAGAGESTHSTRRVWNESKQQREEEGEKESGVSA